MSAPQPLSDHVPPTHEPDAMGAWSEDGDIVWLPRSLYPKRIDAIKWAMGEWSVTLPDVRCLSRYLVHAPTDPEDFTGTGEFWKQCEKETPGAFPAWRLECGW